MTNVSDQVAEEIKTQILFSFLRRKTSLFLDNLGKYGTARPDIDGNIIWRMRCIFWINKAKNTGTQS